MAGKNAQLVWYPEARYDTVVIPVAGIASAVYFTLPIGQTISGDTYTKTEADTNLRNSAQIGNPNQFELHGFAVEPEPIGNGLVLTTNQADWGLIYNPGVFQFQVAGAKNLLTCPLTRLPMAGGVNTFGTVTAGCAMPGNGSPFSSNYYAFHKLDPVTGQKEQLVLEGTTNFAVTLSWPLANCAPTTKIRVRVYMIGYYGSAVQ